MMALMVVLAFAAGVVAKVYIKTGDLSYLATAIVLAVLCVIAIAGWFVNYIREQGVL